jgi:hypothetical protein
VQGSYRSRHPGSVDSGEELADGLCRGDQPVAVPESISQSKPVTVTVTFSITITITVTVTFSITITITVTVTNSNNAITKPNDH